MIPIYDSELATLWRFVADLEARLALQEEELKRMLRDFRTCREEHEDNRLAIRIYSSCSAIVELHAEQLAKDKEKAAALDRTFEIRWREIKEFHRTWSESVAELATLRRYVERKMVAREIWEY